MATLVGDQQQQHQIPTASSKSKQQEEAKKTASINTNKVVPLNHDGEVDSKTLKKKRFEKNDFGFPKLPFGIRYQELIIFVCWIAAISFTIWFIYDVATHYLHALHNPVTSLSLVEHIPMAFPAITICNYNALKHCDTCNLTLEHTTRVLENGSIIDFEMHYDSAVIDSFHCIVMNNDTHHPLPEASLTGYGASYSLFFKVPKMPNNLYFRYGLQVSFHKQGTVPDVVSESNFAMAGVDNFFILTKYHTKYLDSHQSGSSGTVESISARKAQSIKSSGEGSSTSETSSSSSTREEMRWVSIVK